MVGVVILVMKMGLGAADGRNEEEGGGRGDGQQQRGGDAGGTSGPLSPVPWAPMCSQKPPWEGSHLCVQTFM